MKRVLIFAAVVFTIPILTFIVLYIRGGKFLIVHNDGSSSIEIRAQISDGAYLEHTEVEVVPAGKRTWIIFFPKTKGSVSLRCVGGGYYGTISLGDRDTARLLYSNVTLDSCERVLSRSGFGL